MKKTIIKAVALLLAVCLSIVPLVGSIAAEGANNYPVVMVPGVNTRNVLLNPGTDDEQLVFPPSGDRLTATIKDALGLLARLAVNRDWDKFTDALINEVNELFANAALNPDGTAKENVGIDWEYPAPETIIAENGGTFYYDWRLDPMEIANGFSDYIDYIMETTGSDYVVINCHSMGGIITLSYLEQYGYGKIKSVLYDTTAVYGTSSAGKPLSDKVDFNGRAISGFLGDLFLGKENEELIKSLFEILYQLGVFDGVAELGDGLVNKIKVRVYKECLIPLFATMPGIWALVPAQDYDTAKSLCFGDTGDTYSALIEKLDRYHNRVRLNAADLITDSLDYMNVGFISRYNMYMTPVVEDWDVQSDGVLNTRSSSYGATCAPVGGVLPDDYIKEHFADSTRFLSPDRVIDASTCLLPEYTWFIKDFAHSWGTSSLDNLYEAILHSGEQITVDTFEQYPQFMKYSVADDTLVPLTAGGSEKPATMFSSIFEFIKQAITLLIDKLSTLFVKK